MIGRALVRLAGLAALAVAGWWISRAVRGGGRPAAAPAPAPPAEGGRMVRDRVCNTFLPVALALRLDVSGQAHYFCSEACRRRFLRADRGPGSA